MKKTIQLQILILTFLLPTSFSLAQGFEWANQVELLSIDNAAAVTPPLGFDVEKEANGNILMSGKFYVTMKFGDTTLMSTGLGLPGMPPSIYSEDGFIARYSPEGELLWVEQIATGLLGATVDIDVDANGNIYALTHFIDSIKIAGGEYYADEGFAVTKMDADFNVIWNKNIARVGSQSFLYPGSLELSGNDVFVTGNATDEVLLNGVDLNEDFPVFLVSMDQQDGSLNWFKNIGFDPGDISTDDAGNVYWVFTYPLGISQNPLQVGNISINSTNNPVIVYIKIDPSGNIVTTKAFGNDGSINPNRVSQISVASSGDIYLAGTWGDTLNIEGMQLISQITASTGSLLWVAKFNSNEEIQWLKRSYVSSNAGGNIDPVNMEMDVSPDGGVFISSENSQNTDFTFGEGNNAVTFPNVIDGFLIKYNSNGELGWGQKLDCLSVNCDIFVRGLKGVSHNEAVVSGSFTYEFDMGDLTLTAVVPSTVQQPNIYLVKVNGDLMTSTDEIITKHLLFKITPNPTSDFLQIEIKDEFQNAQIEIFDLMGQVLLRTNLDQNTHPISMSNFPNGTYLLRIVGEDFQGIQKFIIQK